MAFAQGTDSDLVMASIFNNMTLTLTANATSLTPLLSAEEQSQIEQYKVTMNAIKRSYMWILFAFGFPGNVFSLLVIVGLRCWGSPALYVATLAVVDNLAIVVKLLLLQFGEHKISLGLVGCKVMFFLGNHLVVYANWVLVTMAVERFFAVWQPLHVSRLWTSRKAAFSLGVVLLITVALTAPLFVTVTVTISEDAAVQECVTDPDYMSFMRVWQLSQATAYGFLPCFLLLTINILIIILIGRARRFQRSMTSSMNHNTISATTTTNDRRSSPGGMQRQATVMLVVTSAVFVLTTTPICVYMLVQQWWDPKRGTAEFEQKKLIRFMLRVMCDANHAVNFYLYFVSARKFRSYFCKVMCLLCSRRLDRQGSDCATRHYSAVRSTLKVKGAGPEGQVLVFERKKGCYVEEDDMCGENNIQLKLYAEAGQNGTGGSPCSSLL